MFKKCRDGIRTRYEVKNMDTDAYGFDLKDRLGKRHNIFEESSSSPKMISLPCH